VFICYQWLTMFDPFRKPLSDVKAVDLALLRDVAEGWYVEYKRTSLNAERIARTLCSFANQYGGWLFLGIEEKGDHSGPAAFPGIDAAHRVTTEQWIRQGAQAHCFPAPYFETHFVNGPCIDLHVPTDRFIAIVRVPPSDDVPHVHSSSRIYRRIGSSSEPHHEADRALVDQLLDRRKRLEGAIRRFTEFRPPLRDGDPSAHVHVYLVTRPEGEYSSKRTLAFNEFVEQLKSSGSQFYNNFYTTPDGYAARAIGRETPNKPHKTLRYGYDGWAHFTIPLDCFDAGHASQPELRHLQHLREFEVAHAISGSMVVDLTSTLISLASLMSQYVQLLKRSGLDGVPIFYRVALEGVWRTVPYLDMASFPAHARQHGLAHIDRELLAWPVGDGYHGLAALEWSPPKTIDPVDVGFPQAAAVFSVVASLMGIDADYVGKNYDELRAAIKFRLSAVTR
jgi:hypothetical protein